MTKGQASLEIAVNFLVLMIVLSLVINSLLDIKKNVEIEGELSEQKIELEKMARVLDDLNINGINGAEVEVGTYKIENGKITANFRDGVLTSELIKNGVNYEPQ